MTDNHKLKSITEQLGKRTQRTKVMFSIRDTEFLIRVLGGTNIQMREAEQAVETFNKIKTIHKKLMEDSYEVKL